MSFLVTSASGNGLAVGGRCRGQDGRPYTAAASGGYRNGGLQQKGKSRTARRVSMLGSSERPRNPEVVKAVVR